MLWRRTSRGSGRVASTCSSTSGSSLDLESGRAGLLERNRLRPRDAGQHFALEHVLHLIAAVQPRNQPPRTADEVGAYDHVEVGVALRRHGERLVAHAFSEAVTLE